jgi:hypothetical protein
MFSLWLSDAEWRKESPFFISGDKLLASQRLSNWGRT